MDFSIPPHGGELISLFEKEGLLKRTEYYRKIPVNSMELSDLIMIGTGAFSPLRGFMGKDDYESVMERMRLSNGTVWPIPITLSVPKELAETIEVGQDVALVGSDNHEVAGIMVVQEKFGYDKRIEAIRVFKTDDERHPGVRRLYERDGVYIGGPVKVLSEGGYPERFPEYARPAETRKIFKEKRWKTVAAFQTRNPLHRSHEYITKVVLETVDGLFIHPVVGKLKDGDIPAEIRMKCYRALLENYYPRERVVCKVYPMEMRYAGPREALLHAIIRQNFGCSHFIVGRDHAGVGSYYGTYEAQEIFDRLSDNDLYIKIVKVDNTFWCNKCVQIASDKTCPHMEDDRLSISGSRLREMLSRGERPPESFSRPEVLDILLQYYN
ncbi:MAG: sulfate adenylyltransferase [Clostridiales bacterium GWC2_40_7]|nr:MAG: sulfate adenylyltransferase [Clostridiales bacterium GWC2_40_7]